MKNFLLFMQATSVFLCGFGLASMIPHVMNENYPTAVVDFLLVLLNAVSFVGFKNLRRDLV